jgi:hypothetical protein
MPVDSWLCLAGYPTTYAAGQAATTTGRGARFRAIFMWRGLHGRFATPPSSSAVAWRIRVAP